MTGRLFAIFSLILFVFSCQTETDTSSTYELVIIQGSTGGTTAGIQAARMGTKTLIIEPHQWLGGMLTSAGVSAIDGNHNMPAGLWGEFRSALRQHYGGAKAIETGWVSNTLFEPHVGAKIWKELAEKETNLDVWYQSQLITATPTESGWDLQIDKNGEKQVLSCKILIDATDLGDVAAAVGASYDVGMDAQSESQESIAPAKSNDIIQDLTYAAILKDFGEGADKTIPKPQNYDPTQFHCSCEVNCDNGEAHPCETMLTYGKLPNEKYMINRPIKGNDYYVNLIDVPFAERPAILAKAKEKTLQFIYYIQHDLGFKNLGIAEDEFPTTDLLPFIPYHREGRRFHGLCRMNVNHILEPYEQRAPLFRTGIAVGDYPIDHHHKELPDAPEIDFPPVPSFNVPLGALIPKNVDNLIIAEKPISVSNIVNGSSRLQPVILQIGQAAGALAATAIQKQQSPKEVDIRALQDVLLNANAYLMPYYDIKPDHPFFETIQRVGATGFIRGVGEPYKWANRTWFYPDTTVHFTDIQDGFKDVYGIELDNDLILKPYLTIDESLFSIWMMAQAIKTDDPSMKQLGAFKQKVEEQWTKEFKLQDFDLQRPMKRFELAVLIEQLFDPFHQKAVDWSGNFVQ
jgi:hypothetical protein